MKESTNKVYDEEEMKLFGVIEITPEELTNFLKKFKGSQASQAVVVIVAILAAIGGMVWLAIVLNKPEPTPDAPQPVVNSSVNFNGDVYVEEGGVYVR